MLNELSNDFEERMINTQGPNFEVAGGNQGSSLAWCGSSTKLETGETLAEGGNDYWKSIGLGFKTPCEAIEGMENNSGSARAKLMKLSVCPLLLLFHTVLLQEESLVEDDSTALVPGEQNEQRASEQVRIDMAHILLFWSELEKLVAFMGIPLIVVFFVVLLASFLLPHLSASLFATCMLRPFICQLLLPLPSCVVSLTSASSLHLTAPSSLTVALHNFIDIVVEGFSIGKKVHLEDFLAEVVVAA
ncbi:hypothetical protein OROHE_005526 [Orobanche hederae]